MPQNIRLVYSKNYAVGIRDHVFPTSKYNLAKDRLLKRPSFNDNVEMISPLALLGGDLLLVHIDGSPYKIDNRPLPGEGAPAFELSYNGKPRYLFTALQTYSPEPGRFPVIEDQV